MKTFLKSAQKQSLSSEICSGSSQSFFSETGLENSREIGRFFREFALENPAKFDYFFRDLPEALSSFLIETDTQLLWKKQTQTQYLIKHEYNIWTVTLVFTQILAIVMLVSIRLSSRLCVWLACKSSAIFWGIHG